MIKKLGIATLLTAALYTTVWAQTLEQQKAAWPDPPYGERAWACERFQDKNGKMFDTCRPFTILRYGEEKETHYRGYNKWRGRVSVDGVLR